MNKIVYIALSPLALAFILIVSTMVGMFLYSIIWSWWGEKIRRKAKHEPGHSVSMEGEG